MTSSQSKYACDSVSLTISGFSGCGTGGGVDSITKVNSFLVTPSVASIVCYPPLLAGALKLAVKVPSVLTVVVVAGSPS